MSSAPKGKAVYARRDLRGRCAAYADRLRLDWVAILPMMAAADAAALRAAGLPFWLYSTPGGDGTPRTSWAVHEYRNTIPNFEALCLQYGAQGYIADVEPKPSDAVNWNTVSDAQVQELAAALLASKQRTGLSIGVTMFYEQRLWRRLGPLVGNDIWMNLQMYDSRRAPERNRAIIDEVYAAGWSIPDLPAIASYMHLQGEADVAAGPGEDVRYLTPAEFTAYVSNFPGLRGAIVWYPIPAPAPESALGSAIARWRPTPWWRLYSNALWGGAAAGILGSGAMLALGRR